MKKLAFAMLTGLLAVTTLYAQDIKKGLPADAKGLPGKSAADYEIVKRDPSWIVMSEWTNEDDKYQMSGRLEAGPEMVSGDDPKPVVIGYYAFMHETIKGKEKNVMYISNSKHILVGRCVYDPLMYEDKATVTAAQDGKAIIVPVHTGNITETDIATALVNAHYL